MTLVFCSLCGQHARHPKSPVPDLRRKPCPRFPGGVIHRGCCAGEVCSEADGQGQRRSGSEGEDAAAHGHVRVRCMWARGGRERLLALNLKARAPGAASSAPAGRA